MYKEVHDMVPQNIKDLFQLRADTVPDTSLRSVSNQNFYIPKPNTSLFKNSLSYSGPIIWNTIPSDIKNSSSINFFLLGKVVEWIANESLTSTANLHCKYHFRIICPPHFIIVISFLCIICNFCVILSVAMFFL